MSETAIILRTQYNPPVSSGTRFAFDRFELDPARRAVWAEGHPLALSDRHVDVLLVLVARAGEIVTKEELLQAGWKDVAVGDNSVEQAISSLRKALQGSVRGPAELIETVPRRGYRFVAPVERRAARASDEGLAALLEPHRAFVEGRAALESLDRDAVEGARGVFERALERVPELASPHIGLANACILHYETTRTDSAPDIAARSRAAHHAREACRLDPQSGEAWATLGFVLDRTGSRLDALAAASRAVTLEPDNWRHHFRLALVSWGEERLRAAHRTLTLLPGFPQAHWLAATVHVARQALGEAERELTSGLAFHESAGQGPSRFSAVALHWLLGLIHHARGDDEAAIRELTAELADEHGPAGNHLYARECCANACYALGAIALQHGRLPEAAAAFADALARVPHHPTARIGLLAAQGAPPPAADADGASSLATMSGAGVEQAIAAAAFLAAKGDHHGAAALVDAALRVAPAGSTVWWLPVEPILRTASRPDTWGSVLAQLRNRAA